MSGSVARSLGNLADTLGTTATANVNFDSGVLFIDGVNNRVGIGTANTLGNSLLNVASGIVARSDTAGVAPYLQLYNLNAGSNLKTWRMGAQVNGGFNIESVNDAYSSASEFMRIDALGRVTMPNQPAFTAYGGGNLTVTSTNVVMPLAGILTNRGSHYNTSTYRFTAPVAGVYLFAHRVTWASTGAGVSVFLAVNGNSAGGSGNNTEVFGYTTGTSYHTTSASISVLQLSVNDFVDLRSAIYNSSAQTLDLTRSSFTGYLIG